MLSDTINSIFLNLFYKYKLGCIYIISYILLSQINFMEHSAIVWIQIPAQNLKRAVTFYEEIFDASFFLEVLNGIPHAIFKDGKKVKKLINGAIIKKENYQNNSLGPVLYFNATGNFETIMELIEEYGGKISTPKKLITAQEDNDTFTIPNTYIDGRPGYFAHFIDSEGNRMGLYGTN